MDHRNGERIKVVLPASLRQGRNFLGWFTTRDISRTGLALHGSVPGLAINSIITVTIELNNDGAANMQDYPALVVRQQQDCLGLMWVEDEINLQPLLSASAEMATSPLAKPFSYQQNSSARDSSS